MRELQRPFAIGLGTSDLALVGTITVDWGAIDTMLGIAINHMQQVKNGKSSAKNFKENIDEKARILRKLTPSCPTPTVVGRYVEEVEYCLKMYKQSRNTAAHGLTATTPDGMGILNPKGGFLKPSDLPIAVEQSTYTLFIAYRLMQVAINPNQDIDWPARPRNL